MPIHKTFIKHLLQARYLIEEVMMFKPDIIPVLINLTLVGKTDMELKNYSTR